MITTAGPLTRSVLDAAAFLDLLAGNEPGDGFVLPTPERTFAAEVGRDPGRLRIAVSLGGREIEPAYRSLLDDTIHLLEGLGHRVEEADPDPTWGCLFEETLPYAFGVPGLPARIRALPTLEGLDPLVSQLAEYSGTLTAELLVQREADLYERARRISTFLAQFDMLLSPTVAKAPPLVGAHRELDVPELITMWEEYGPFTAMWNWTGQPAISVPAGLDDRGLPVGMQLVGQLGNEAALLRVAAQLEQVRPWKGHPQVPVEAGTV